MGRFLNADSFASTGQGFLGYNMFAYCNNNPVNSTDISGGRPKDIQDDYHAVAKGNPEQQNKPIAKIKTNSSTAPKGYFKTPENAARAFRCVYYKQSIDNQLEYGSAIYRTTIKNQVWYYYQPPTIGTRREVEIDTSPRNKGDIEVASVHTHVIWGDETVFHFSKKDITTYYSNKNAYSEYVAYLIVPGGQLKGYGELTNGTIGEAWLLYEPGRYLYTTYSNCLH